MNLAQALIEREGAVDCDECGGIGTYMGTSEVCALCGGTGEMPAGWADREDED